MSTVIKRLFSCYFIFQKKKINLGIFLKDMWISLYEHKSHLAGMFFSIYLNLSIVVLRVIFLRKYVLEIIIYIKCNFTNYTRKANTYKRVISKAKLK